MPLWAFVPPAHFPDRHLNSLIKSIKSKIERLSAGFSPGECQNKQIKEISRS